ncbi:hypothetical protein [Chromobacterium violaceum]|uniref:hypothetical protein n=1 Tax=Chromobacterium violaceum TaxID=536 RepID=UPI001CE1836E|nr:hypothetical protein [Chromobacterium violaceum]
MHAEKRSYLQLLSNAITTSKEIFRFPNDPLVNEHAKISDADINQVRDALHLIWRRDFGHIFGLYWGNKCQYLSAHIAAFTITVLGLPAEIIIGEVSINGTLEYDTTLEGLKSEYFSQTPLKGNQNLHAWVSIGGDVIIDAALSDRLARYYMVPRDRLPDVMVGQASMFLHSGLNFSACYQPIIYGSDFLEKTAKISPSILMPVYQEIYADSIQQQNTATYD